MHSDQIHLVRPLPTFIFHLSSFIYLFIFPKEVIKLHQTIGVRPLNAPSHKSAGNGRTAQPVVQGSEPELELEPRRREELLINEAKKGRRKSLHFPATGTPFLPQTNSLLIS